MISSNASFSPAAIMDAADRTQTLFFQLYKHRDDALAEKRVREIEQLGYKAIFLTVDAVVAGNRERDIRSPWVLEEEELGPVYHEEITKADQPENVNVFGTAGALVANDDRDMTWEKVGPYHSHFLLLITCYRRFLGCAVYQSFRLLSKVRGSLEF